MRDSRPPVEAVVDTNVFVSGLLVQGGPPHRVVLALHDDAFTPLVSPSLQAEYEDVLTRPRLARAFRLDPSEVLDFRELLRRRSKMVWPLAALPLSVRDPNDEMLLAAALGGHARSLVTGDKVLLVLGGDPRLGPLQIVTIVDFLAVLQEPAADTVE